MHPGKSSASLHTYFAGLAEHTFEARLGVADPHLVDYLADLLSRFIHSDALYRLRTPGGRRVREVATMLLEAEARVGEARREVHRHIGDYTLFWTGVYPEALPRLQAAHGADRLLDYATLGKRAYHIASQLSGDDRTPQGDVLERLSHQFELCQYGLGEVRREWERRDGDDDIPRPVILH
jgi:hypothetical protein